ncbi:MAG: archease [Candidatus Methanofastidiosa archaeon]|nr:archease [Candidatus Methanofastidiosa archaeon]
MEYEIIDHPADIGFKVTAPTLKKAFEKAGKALCSLLLTDFVVAEEEERTFYICSDDLHSLLYDYLERLLVHFEIDDFIPNDIDLEISKEEDRYGMSGKIAGFRIDPSRCTRKYEIKAITYHMMKVEHVDGVWIVQAIVDI